MLFNLRQSSPHHQTTGTRALVYTAGRDSNNRQRALQKHLCRCLLASWNLDQNLGETYEYVLEIADRPSRLGFPEGTLTSVYVYEHERSNSIPIIISLSSTTDNEPL